jgi:hypothetical protein
VLGCYWSYRALAREPLDSLLTDGSHAGLATETHLDADRFTPETRTIPHMCLSSSVVDSEKADPRRFLLPFLLLFSPSRSQIPSRVRVSRCWWRSSAISFAGGGRRSCSLAEAGDLGRWEFRRRGSVNRAVVRRALRRGVRLPRRCSATIFGRGEEVACVEVFHLSTRPESARPLH